MQPQPTDITSRKIIEVIRDKPGIGLVDLSKAIGRNHVLTRKRILVLYASGTIDIISGQGPDLRRVAYYLRQDSKVTA